MLENLICIQINKSCSILNVTSPLIVCINNTYMYSTCTLLFDLTKETLAIENSEI